IDRGLVEKELKRRSGMPVRVNNDQGTTEPTNDEIKNYPDLTPIEPFSISQPQPVYEEKIGALLPSKYKSYQ
ncbi:MAG: L,D-transpeptidase family protein, partial [Providencia sp.]